ncbi:MAG: riboflavin kinase, partial [Bowdeniella nasicola]|nr:riboflavin kinase [Bowdeniella nasicola]
RPEAYLTEITTASQRQELLREAGVDEIITLAYSLEFAKQSPHDFVVNHLVNELHAAVVVEGEDVRFGANNAGDARTLEQLGAQLGFDVVIVNDLTDAKTGRRWSSTWVREALLAGDVAEAARILGRPHRIRGIVEHGVKRGRELGFPTANVHAEGIGVAPADGVYAGWLYCPVEGRLPAAISVGTNPHFAGERRTVEAHVLSRADLDLYHTQVDVAFIDRIRPMRSFASLEALLSAMDDDLVHTSAVLGVAPAQRVNPADVTAH